MSDTAHEPGAEIPEDDVEMGFGTAEDGSSRAMIVAVDDIADVNRLRLALLEAWRNAWGCSWDDPGNHLFATIQMPELYVAAFGEPSREDYQ